MCVSMISLCFRDNEVCLTPVWVFLAEKNTVLAYVPAGEACRFRQARWMTKTCYLEWITTCYLWDPTRGCWLLVQWYVVYHTWGMVHGISYMVYVYRTCYMAYGTWYRTWFTSVRVTTIYTIFLASLDFLREAGRVLDIIDGIWMFLLCSVQGLSHFFLNSQFLAFCRVLCCIVPVYGMKLDPGPDLVARTARLKKRREGIPHVTHAQSVFFFFFSRVAAGNFALFSSFKTYHKQCWKNSPLIRFLTDQKKMPVIVRCPHVISESSERAATLCSQRGFNLGWVKGRQLIWWFWCFLFSPWHIPQAYNWQAVVAYWCTVLQRAERIEKRPSGVCFRVAASACYCFVVVLLLLLVALLFLVVMVVQSFGYRCILSSLSFVLF